MSQLLELPKSTVSPTALKESHLSPADFEILLSHGIIAAHQNTVSGAVVFSGTRVPAYNLWDYLNGGDSIDDFLESFPTVRREQIHQALELAQDSPSYATASA